MEHIEIRPFLLFIMEDDLGFIPVCIAFRQGSNVITKDTEIKILESDWDYHISLIKNSHNQSEELNKAIFDTMKVIPSDL